MEFLFTQDPYVLLTWKGYAIRIYTNIVNFESWLITGECNLCGDCIDGAVNPDTRPAHKRLDIVVRPEIQKMKNCSLRGVYL